VCEGSIPTKDNGDYLKIAAPEGTDVLQEVGSKAAAIIAIGSCASWGGIPSSGDNPTGAVGVSELVRGVPIVNIPGCPPNPYTLMGTLLEIMRTGAPPQLDAEHHRKFAYDRVIHEQCPRRAHFDSGTASPRSSATRAIVRDGASTSWAARAPTHTPAARCVSSTKCPTSGRSALAHLA
jgi:hydrogenase small subunit